ncbi:wiskott-Aldrich syndrome protein family member 1-like [Cervus elaphus]|uniref:wiskott-Aldrich syndrome protein family member 1-like n=1 Tax=Cervus elaphus TaxID=9860 RepID=UPI001CC27DC0|nr:wiskott-Aldrich syndrome protein family member 1-like [Cervus elaphus]
MSLNKEKDEGPSNQSAGPRKIREELVYVTQTSLNNIARQVNDLNKYTEYIFGELTKEVDRLCFKLKTLQQSVIQLTDGITQDDPNKGASLQVRKSKRMFQNTAFQSQQVYSSKSVKRCGKHDSCVQTSSLTMPARHCQDGRESLKIYPVSYSEGEEQKGGKVKLKKKHLDYPYEPKRVPQGQPIEDNITVGHITTDACGETSHSYVDQSAENSFCSFPFSEISKLLTRTVGKVLSSPLQQPMHGAGDVKNSHTYVNYGTGMGEDLKPQPRTRLKTEVFVSPTAPNSPPPLPSDWLAVLRASERTSLSSVMHSLTQLTQTVFNDPAASPPPDCLQTTLDSPLLITPPETDFSPPTPEPFQYELIPDDLVPQSKDQEMPPPLSPLVTSPRIKSRAAVTDLNDSASDVQSPRSSVPSRLISSLPPPPPPPRSSIAPRSSTPQTLQSSIPLSSVSSYPQTSVSLIPLSKPSVAQLPRCSVAQPSGCLDTQSSRSSVAQPTGNLTTPHPRSSSLKSTKLSTLQSLFSFVQSPSSISSPWALSVSQSSSTPVCPGFKQSPSALPMINKARMALMEAIRKGVLLRKTKEQCIPKVKMEIPKNEASHILIRRKAMGYSSGISDSETDWMEEE